MISRVRYYIYFFTLLSLSLFALWGWWWFPEDVRYGTYRDMGLIESLQIVCLATFGLSACWLHNFELKISRETLFSYSLGQFLGMSAFVLIFRELDYFVTYFMYEDLFMYALTGLALMTAAYGIVHAKAIFQDLRRLFHFSAMWFFGLTSFGYLFVAQAIGTKVFRRLFFPEVADLSRRYLEESIELGSLLILCAGMLELYIEIYKRHRVSMDTKNENVHEEIWKTFRASPTGYPREEIRTGNEGGTGGVRMATVERTLTNQEDRVVPETLELSSRSTEKILNLEQAAFRVERSNRSLGASILFVGIILAGVIMWRGFIWRESAIDATTDRQLQIISAQYNNRLEEYKRGLEAYERRPRRWKKQNVLSDQEFQLWGPSQPFRFYELRKAIRNNVAGQFKFAGFFKWNSHRD